ncbi:MAG: class I SAM-dependent DNA methyltransferase [Myxococcota bacterium]
MSVFGSYSRYYDLLYKDKDYASEAEYVQSLILRHRPEAKSILDLGCGTGRHAQCLARKGYAVTGLDRSEQMLETARSSQRSETEAADVSGATPEFLQGDLRDVRLGREFDVVVSLFHVMSYQTSNADLKAALLTVREHLKPGGVFLFDCWYGPAVLTQRPQVRIQRLEDEHLSVTRLAEPVMRANENLVDVNYQIFIHEKDSGRVDQLSETHTMRYLFAPEIELLFDSVGLRLLQLNEFMGSSEPSVDTWNAMFVGARP